MSDTVGTAVPSARVICIGNRFRRDDAIGLEVAKRLRAAAPVGVEIVELEGEPTSLIDAWGDVPVVYLVDAVSSGGAPGTVYRFDVVAEAPPAQLRHRGTHAFSVADVVELARAVDRLPSRLVVFGIEVGGFGAGVGLSPGAERGARAAAASLVDELARGEAER